MSTLVRVCSTADALARKTNFHSSWLVRWESVLKIGGGKETPCGDKPRSSSVLAHCHNQLAFYPPSTSQSTILLLHSPILCQRGLSAGPIIKHDKIIHRRWRVMCGIGKGTWAPMATVRVSTIFADEILFPGLPSSSVYRQTCFLTCASRLSAIPFILLR